MSFININFLISKFYIFALVIFKSFIMASQTTSRSPSRFFQMCHNFFAPFPPKITVKVYRLTLSFYFWWSKLYQKVRYLLCEAKRKKQNQSQNQSNPKLYC